VPELPEVQALVNGLADHLTGGRIDALELASFSALKTVSPAIGDLAGHEVTAVERRGKMVCLQAGSLWLVVHLARGGWIRWYPVAPTPAARPSKSKITLRVRMEDASGFDVTEMGTEKRVALWVVRSPEEVEAVGSLGVDPLDPGFTTERLASLVGGNPATLKHLMTTQSVIAGVGNAYSDEILHRAKLSPFKKAANLDGDEVAALHAAMVGVLGEALDRASIQDLAELKGDKKRAMEVHGRAGQACPACGDTVRSVSYSTRSMEYCPTCQTGGKILADRRLSRLLK
jgi:formamidopyrimidine-DNA glycosylase